jgi:Flp pilus assembly protein TadG
MKPIFFPTQRGQALIIIALASIGLVAIVGLALDGSAKFSDRRHAQNAADTAVLAGGLARVSGDSQWKLTALDRALSNGYNNNLISNSVVVYACDETDSDCGPYTGNPDYIRVVVDSYVNTYFARIVGINQTHNTVESIAMSKTTSKGGPLYAGSSVWATKSSGSCSGTSKKSLYTGGSGELQLYGGGMGASMSVGSCIDFSGGNTQFHKDGTSCGDLTTAATSIPSANLKSLHDPDKCMDIVLGATFDDPPKDLGITCTGTAAPISKGSNIMSPGNYTDKKDFPPAGIDTLQPGTYCISQANFILNNKQKLSGAGVTIVMSQGLVRWNGGSETNLTSPTSGDLKGLLIYFPPSNTSDLDINGNSNVTLTGTVLAQNAPCFFAGTGQIQKATLQFVCYTWEGGGDSNVQLIYNSSLFWDQILPSRVGLVQ